MSAKQSSNFGMLITKYRSEKASAKQTKNCQTKFGDCKATVKKSNSKETNVNCQILGKYKSYSVNIKKCLLRMNKK